MDKETAIKLRWKVLSGGKLTEEDLDRISLIYSNQEPDNYEKGFKEEPDYNTDSFNAYGKQFVKSNGKSLLEKDNKPNNLGMSNTIFLATISFVMELTFLIISLFIFN